MWTASITTIEKDRVYKYEILEEEQYLTFQDFLQKLQESTEFRTYFNRLLADVSFNAFFWECRGVDKDRLDNIFEFVVVESKTLAGIKENGEPFQRYFLPEISVVSFLNLSGSALLIAPTPESSECYAHLADFVRKAPPEQQDDFWILVSSCLRNTIGDRKRWWSTSGLGVHWLHLRIDNVPKYYQYRPYRKES